MQIKRSFSKASLAELFPKSATLPALVLKNEQQKYQSTYSVSFQGIRDLIPEITKHYSSFGNTLKSMEDLLLVYNQTGNLRAALKYFTGVFGKSIVKPLAFLTPKMDLDQPSTVRDLLLFRMYVDTGRIENLTVRQNIREVISYLTEDREALEFKFQLKPIKKSPMTFNNPPVGGQQHKNVA